MRKFNVSHFITLYTSRKMFSAYNIKTGCFYIIHLSVQYFVVVVWETFYTHARLSIFLPYIIKVPRSIPALYYIYIICIYLAKEN